ncbi:hypothetical protein [Sandaracinus amylolyticus]|uniref:hypothetical protein n=1 Tax=Sandaracinus amylolyticus TaxID=927083 RepID=UPI001F24D22F|nr:hypothetical protein [Sandaracinus amylolyticus]UJR86319.1 Hypothetical protein I5071_84030 [Sandaracinus amylolyticus]
MAIDFVIMPLSRYIAGDFVTPAMELAWSAGVPYAVIRPDGTTTIPPHTPFGGPDAPARRARFVDMVLEDLRAIPAIASTPWDERSDAAPAFHRVDASAYAALLEEASSARKRGLFGLLGTTPPAEHLTTGLFVPHRVETTFVMESPIKQRVGSVPRALEELAARTWSPLASSAVATLRAALEDAARLRLPMIVDQ